MKLTSLIHTFLNNVTSKVQFSFYLEGDNYNITLDYSAKFEYDSLKNTHSVNVLDSYRDADIIEFWATKDVVTMYADTKKQRFYIIKILRNGEPIRLYGRSRLFFDK